VDQAEVIITGEDNEEQEPDVNDIPPRTVTLEMARSAAADLVLFLTDNLAGCSNLTDANLKQMHDLSRKLDRLVLYNSHRLVQGSILNFLRPGRQQGGQGQGSRGGEGDQGQQGGQEDQGGQGDQGQGSQEGQGSPNDMDLVTGRHTSTMCSCSFDHWRQTGLVKNSHAASGTGLLA
jgi:hypothetical protein